MSTSVIGKYIVNVLISIDQLVNTIFGGDPDETISSRVGKNFYNRGWNKLGKLIDFLFSWQKKNHCLNAIEEDEGKDQVTRH